MNISQVKSRQIKFVSIWMAIQEENMIEQQQQKKNG